MKDVYIPQILTFWFSEIEPKQWFTKSEAFDQSLTEKFGPLVADALGGRLDGWAKDKDGSLALILLLDQMTRNIHRGTPLSFAGDEMALAIALRAIDKGFLEDGKGPRNLFMLMPLMHSEDISIHHKALPLFTEHAPEMSLKSLGEHTAIIARFGHYPHRNEILGRPSTDEEIAFLKEPGSSF